MTPTKYRNRPEVSSLAGRRFDSAGERRRGEELVLAEKAGAIRDLRFQVTFRLDVNGVHITNYRADFVYEEGLPHGTPGKTAVEWHSIVEDFKGVVTDVYRIKRALIKACLGIEIRETHAKRGRRA